MPKTPFQICWNQAKQRALADGLKIVEHGWEQHVIIDEPNGLVYRYPRHQDASNKLADEVALLRTLNQSEWTVRIPFLRHHTNQYSVYDYIPGSVVDSKVARLLSDNETANLGHDLGLFLAQLHGVSTKIIEEKMTKQTMSLLNYYCQRINHGKKSEFYKKACQDLDQIIGHPAVAHTVVHGDLHGLNMVIDSKTKQLVGVIDFSELEIGDPHQDFRKLFMTDERLLAPSLEKYGDVTGKKLSEEIVKAWAYVNEWANVCFYYQTPSNPTYRRAYGHLKKWSRL